MQVTSSSSAKRKLSDATDTAATKTKRETVQCAICFESVTHRTELPCACRVDYCARCWDHALAASFRSCGSARCPTCRTMIRVDVTITSSDQCPPRHMLTFSREDRDPQSLDSERELIRLAQQARELQIMYLRLFRTSLQNSSPNSTIRDPPKCVCGNALEKISLRDRIRSCGFGGIICDICERSVSRGKIWTCGKGYDTVLHPASHDVCTRCFDHHVIGADDASAETSPHSSGEVDSETEFNDVGSNATHGATESYSSDESDAGSHADETALPDLPELPEEASQRFTRLSAQIEVDADALIAQLGNALQGRSAVGVVETLRECSHRVDRLERMFSQMTREGPEQSDLTNQLLRSVVAVRSTVQNLVQVMSLGLSPPFSDAPSIISPVMSVDRSE